MRVIAGSARGRRLGPVPPGVRPTSDRVRESLFNSLGQFFDGGAVLDLYAGTGSLGIEALSRGFGKAVFVENERKAITAIQDNLHVTGFEDRAEIMRSSVKHAVETMIEGGRLFHLILLDPPYKIAATEMGSVFSRLPALLATGGKIVVESGEAPGKAMTGGMKGVTRRYGGTYISIFERSDLTMNLAVCPGSFDPITEGHVDIIRRAAVIFDHVVVAVGGNLRKKATLSAEDRGRLIEKVTGDLDNVSVEVMTGLLVEFAREQGARVIVKGLRAVSDFELEFEQAQLNRNLYPELETVFIMSAAEYSFLSSSAVREIAGLGGDVRGLVPEGILDTVREQYSGDSRGEHETKG
ncbi:MAG: pantetheine-phosphate adenylyltransferase [Rubrobacteraceae bacterium]